MLQNIRLILGNIILKHLYYKNRKVLIYLFNDLFLYVGIEYNIMFP